MTSRISMCGARGGSRGIASVPRGRRGGSSRWTPGWWGWRGAWRVRRGRMSFTRTLHEGIGIARLVRVAAPSSDSRGAGAARGRVPRVLDVQGGLADETLDHRFLPDIAPVREPLEAFEGWLDRSADVVVTSHAGAARALCARFRVPAERVRAIGDAGTLGPPDPARTRAARERWGLGAGPAGLPLRRSARRAPGHAASLRAG